ncbi:MAG TPA: imidazole glycerol phosphate synthase subunit HisF [Gemmatimonadales bacterium]|nr:imidazole glycerol phosphate synthase subunit HisF [Gemmatimonadales bacterium]
MSLARRIIACLDTDGARVVKGVKFEGLRDAGDPAALAARYDREGADEVVVLDVAAARDHRPTFVETIRRTAGELSIPLTAGGGIRTLADARAVVDAGADKVTVNTAAVRDPALLTELSDALGSQAVVLAIDALARAGRWEVCVRGGRQPAGLDAVDWAAEGAERGAGEILLTSIDRDGTQSGFACDLVAAVTGAVGVPVVASGGARAPEDFLRVFEDGRADAALAASTFHDGLLAIADVKAFLAARGLPVRQA